MITQDRLKELFRYEPDTGLFIRIVDRSANAKAGDIAGVNSRGYLVIYVDGKLYFAHRLAWLYMTGRMPEMHIDHIDGVKNNNRFLNLRDISNAMNTQNVKRARPCNRSTGLLGVTVDKRRGTFKAQIKISGKNLYLGDFDNPLSASEAYQKAKKIHHTGSVI